MKVAIKISALFVICLIGYNTLTYKDSVEKLSTDIKYLDGYCTYEEKEFKLAESINAYINSSVSSSIASIEEQNGMLDSNLGSNTEEKDEEIIVEESPKVETPVVEKAPVSVVQPSNDTIIETITGSISAYGPDCYGCTSNRTASGYYVGEGNIYYSDSTYGDVRIVAGDSKFPFGSIIIITNYLDRDPFYAIVLDRGGGIGLNKRAQFDLLYAKEADANPYGIQSNVTFDVVRMGY